ncbi:Aly/REF export factor 2 [Paramicrosporidium saccamoebae]|uniref:Aly/REF export factor 2 n=1 Tax=Paramicrosporidium saccamoebae TaxID=1246581 RepID=A0A2H9TIW2_9FUNG|nr:Aly/REF export factor 2 [Paramicrosporidium saccamoebae]
MHNGGARESRPSAVDMALDEVIRSNQSQPRRRRPSTAPRRSPPRLADRHVFTVRNDRRENTRGSSSDGKIIVSNLFHKELFSQVGSVKNVWINYDRAGRSNGSAEVVFYNRRDTLLASDRFHHMPLDGYPMQIEIMPSSSHPRSNNPPPRRHSAGIRKPARNAPRRTERPADSNSLDADLDSYMMRE